MAGDTLVRTGPVAAEDAPPPVRHDLRRLDRLWRWLTGVSGLVIAAAMLLPVVWMVLTAFKPESDIVAYPPTLWPRELTLEHFGDIWSQIPFARLYGNTIVFAGAVTVLSLLFDAMAA